MHSEKTTIRLVAVDMDGTLLHDDKSISDYTLDVLRRIVKKGVILVPASGRPIGGMKEAVLNNVDGIQVCYLLQWCHAYGCTGGKKYL